MDPDSVVAAVKEEGVSALNLYGPGVYISLWCRFLEYLLREKYTPAMVLFSCLFLVPLGDIDHLADDPPPLGPCWW